MQCNDWSIERDDTSSTHSLQWWTSFSSVSYFLFCLMCFIFAIPYRPEFIKIHNEFESFPALCIIWQAASYNTYNSFILYLHSICYINIIHTSQKSCQRNTEALNHKHFRGGSNMLTGGILENELCAHQDVTVCCTDTGWEWSTVKKRKEQGCSQALAVCAGGARPDSRFSDYAPDGKCLCSSVTGNWHLKTVSQFSCEFTTDWSLKMVDCVCVCRLE